MSPVIEQNGMGGGIATALHCFRLTDNAPMSNINSGASEEFMKKVYKQTEYSKKLRDPRWQKKRLDIMNRDEFTCRKCFDDKSTLNVHHSHYITGREPWDYPESLLITLCESCHEHETLTASAVKSDLINILCSKGFLADDLYLIAAGFVQFDAGVPEVEATVLNWLLCNDELYKLVREKYFESIRNDGGEQ